VGAPIGGAKQARVFSFDEMRQTHRIMEAGEAGGKMAVGRS